MSNKINTELAMQGTAQGVEKAIADTEFVKLKKCLTDPKSKEVSAFIQVLGEDGAPKFIRSLLIMCSSETSYALRKCTSNSIISCALACCASGLSIEPSFGQAAIVPFGNKATFMPMKKGLIKLALQTGAVSNINSAIVYEGDILSQNPFTGEIKYNEEPHDRTKIIGYIGYIRLLNGFEKYNYMTLEEIQNHGKRYSKSYYNSRGLWQTNFEAMANKTVLKPLVSGYCPIDPLASLASMKLATALKYDTSTPDTYDIGMDGTLEYPDSVPYAEVINAETKKYEYDEENKV